MNKDVLINVTGLQMTDSDGNSQPIEMIVPGNYYFKNGSHYLRYEEILDESGEPTVNYVKLSPTSMEVRKKGLVNVHMVFEKGKKKHGKLYHAVWHYTDGNSRHRTFGRRGT